MKNKLPVYLLTAASSVMAITGCKSNDLVFTTYTKVGLHITAVDSTPTSLIFGYKRFEGAIIPVDRDKATGKPEDVGSVYAAMAITNAWLKGLSIQQSFATGDAAVEAAKVGIVPNKP